MNATRFPHLNPLLREAPHPNPLPPAGEGANVKGDFRPLETNEKVIL